MFTKKRFQELHKYVFSLPIILGFLSFELPHVYFLTVEQRPTFLERETTLWLTYLLLILSAALSGYRSSSRPWVAGAELLTGVIIAVGAYLITTTDLGSQVYGSIPPTLLWPVLLAIGLALTAPAVAIGLVLGRAAARARQHTPC